MSSHPGRVDAAITTIFSYMAGGVTAVSKTWHPLPDGVKDIILEFLNVEPLMPPERLHLSKVRERPVMPRAAAERCVVYVTREEIMHNALTDMEFFSGLRTLHRPGRTFLTPNEELAFCRKWEAKCGSPWPYAHGEVHPMLRAMVMRFRANLVPLDP